MLKLEIAHDEAAIQKAVDEMARAKNPGFQADPEMSITDVLRGVEGAMDQYVPGFRFNAMNGEDEVARGNVKSHIHPTLNGGVIVHHNKRTEGGEASIILQSSRPGTLGDRTPSLGIPYGRLVRIGKRYVGPLATNTFTVFSVGMRNLELGVDVGPTFHGIKAGRQVLRVWSGHLFDPYKKEVERAD